MNDLVLWMTSWDILNDFCEYFKVFLSDYFWNSLNDFLGLSKDSWNSLDDFLELFEEQLDLLCFLETFAFLKLSFLEIISWNS